MNAYPVNIVVIHNVQGKTARHLSLYLLYTKKKKKKEKIGLICLSEGMTKHHTILPAFGVKNLKKAKKNGEKDEKSAKEVKINPTRLRKGSFL